MANKIDPDKKSIEEYMANAKTYAMQPVKAKKVEHETCIQLYEGRWEKAHPGDYVVQQPGGGLVIIAGLEFESLFAEVKQF
jgi:hypothetical protein